MDEIREMQSIVGYTPDGKPIFQQDLVERIRRAEKDIKNGNVMSLEDFERESDNW